MKTRSIFRLLLLSLCLGFASFAIAQHTAKVHRLRVDFPEKPLNESNAQRQMYRLKTADSTASLIAMAIDLTASGLDSAAYAAQVESDEFWAQVEASYMQSFKGGKLLKATRNTVAGNAGMWMEITRPAKEKDKKDDVVYAQIFVLGVHSCQVVFVSRQGKASSEARDKFFKSIAIQ